MDYLIKVEVVGDYDLCAIGFMDDNDTVIMDESVTDAESLSAEEANHAALLAGVAREQIAILRAAQLVAA
jgi:hypothetical protein